MLNTVWRETKKDTYVHGMDFGLLAQQMSCGLQLVDGGQLRIAMGTQSPGVPLLGPLSLELANQLVAQLQGAYHNGTLEVIWRDYGRRGIQLGARWYNRVCEPYRASTWPIPAWFSTPAPQGPVEQPSGNSVPMAGIKWVKVEHDRYQFEPNHPRLYVSSGVEVLSSALRVRVVPQLEPIGPVDLIGPFSPELAKQLVDQLAANWLNLRLEIAWRETQEGSIKLACRAWPLNNLPWPASERGRSPAWYQPEPLGPKVLWDNLTGTTVPFRYNCEGPARAALRYTGEWKDGGVQNLDWREVAEGYGPLMLEPIGPMPVVTARKLIQDLFDQRPDLNWIIPYRIVEQGTLVCLGIGQVEAPFFEGIDLGGTPGWFKE